MVPWEETPAELLRSNIWKRHEAVGLQPTTHCPTLGGASILSFVKTNKSDRRNRRWTILFPRFATVGTPSTNLEESRGLFRWLGLFAEQSHSTARAPGVFARWFWSHGNFVDPSVFGEMFSGILAFKESRGGSALEGHNEGYNSLSLCLMLAFKLVNWPRTRYCYYIWSLKKSCRPHSLWPPKLAFLMGRAIPFKMFECFEVEFSWILHKRGGNIQRLMGGRISSGATTLWPWRLGGTTTRRHGGRVVST